MGSGANAAASGAAHRVDLTRLVGRYHRRRADDGVHVVNALPDLYPFFEWCDNTRVGAAIRDSRFLFPLIETIHLFALTILLGTVIVVGVRMMRISLRRESLAELTAGLLPW